MKLGDNDKNWLKAEISKQVADATSQEVDKFNPHGWKQAAFWLRQLGPIAATVAIIVTLLGITLSAVYYSTANVKEETKFRTTTESRLSNIEDSLKKIIGELARQNLITHSALPLAEFNATLPELGFAITTAKQQRVRVTPTVLNDLQNKMVESGKAGAAAGAPAGFWPAAAEFISYRSQSTISDYQSLLRPDLPNCTDHDPAPMEIKSVSSDRHKAELINAYYKDCRVTLDSAQDDARINSILERFAPTLNFIHCLVVYQGGPINLIIEYRNRPLRLFVTGHPEHPVSTTFTGSTLHFENSLFNVVLPTTPPEKGQQLTQTLLAETSSSFDLSILKPTEHS